MANSKAIKAAKKRRYNKLIKELDDIQEEIIKNVLKIERLQELNENLMIHHRRVTKQLDDEGQLCIKSGTS